MSYQQRSDRAASQNRPSRKSLVLAAVFIAALVVAAFADTDALLEYYKFLRGLPGVSLETGAIITAACIIPLLAMGMSIAEDDMHGHH